MAFTRDDVVKDTPTNTFATLNNVQPTTYVTGEGNLLYSKAGLSDGWQIATATLGVSIGKWYWEISPSALSAFCSSIISPKGGLYNLPGQVDNYGVTYYNNGYLYKYCRRCNRYFIRYGLWVCKFL